MVENELFIGSTQYLTLFRRCRLNRCRSKRVDSYCNYNSENIYKPVPLLSAGVITIKLRMFYFEKFEYYTV